MATTPEQINEWAAVCEAVTELDESLRAMERGDPLCALCGKPARKFTVSKPMVVGHVFCPTHGYVRAASSRLEEVR